MGPARRSSFAVAAAVALTLLGTGLAVPGGLAAGPASATTGSYTDTVDSTGYHQIVLSGDAMPPPAEFSAGDYKADVSWTSADGLQRSYRIIVPSTLAAGANAPYVVTMGGLYTSLATTQAAQNWEQSASERKFVLVYAKGYKGSFNAGVCCGYAAANNVDDEGYLLSVLTYAQAQRSRDVKRTFMSGFSNGGMMAYRFACNRSDVVAAIGVVAGTNESACTPSARKTAPVAVRHIHGGADTTVPYAGTSFASFCSCSIAAVPPVLKSWQRTDKGTWAAVASTLVSGMGHRWPASADGFGIDATSEFLAFFEANPRP